LEIYQERMGEVLQLCSFVVGDGSHISFWHDWWCGERSLKHCYPVLYSIVRNKAAMVVDNLAVHNGNIH
jgi:hypothetical protein